MFSHAAPKKKGFTKYRCHQAIRWRRIPSLVPSSKLGGGGFLSIPTSLTAAKLYGGLELPYWYLAPSFPFLHLYLAPSSTVGRVPHQYLAPSSMVAKDLPALISMAYSLTAAKLYSRIGFSHPSLAPSTMEA